MMKSARFVAIVQTGALVSEMMALREGRVPKRRAVGVVAMATEIPEEALPFDVPIAADEFLDYNFADAPIPQWYATWQSEQRRW